MSEKKEIKQIDKETLWSELEELLGYTGKEGTYLHWLTRSKEGYSYNTVTIHDFVPVSEDDNLMNDLIEYITRKLNQDRESFKARVMEKAEERGFREVMLGKRFIELNDLQKILEGEE